MDVLAVAKFPEQVTAELLTQNLLYMVAACAVVIAVAGLCLIDVGLVKRRNVLESATQKVVGFLIGAGAYAIVGFGLWEYQYYEAFGISNPLGQAISDWWIGSSYVNEIASNIDPAAAAGASNSQIFLVFLALYAGFVCVLIHLGGLERITARAYYTICFGVGAVFYPVMLWLTWGSTSPLTNAGVHDFLGAFVGYIFAGAFALILAWRIGPRAGMFKPHPGMSGTAAPYNLGLSAVGVLMVLFAIPLVAIGCLYYFPEEGFFGIAMSETGIGTVFLNVMAAFVGGAVTGAILAYRQKNVVYALLGPLAGSISGAAGFDVLDPWVMLLIGAGAPLPTMAVYKWLQKREIDEQKIVPLGLGAGVYGVLMVGLVEWGTGTGGFFGIEEGSYVFQGAEINLLWQGVGVAATFGIAALAALVLVVGVEKTIGLRVSPEREVEGLDLSTWSAPPVGAELAPPQDAPVVIEELSPS